MSHQDSHSTALDPPPPPSEASHHHHPHSQPPPAPPPPYGVAWARARSVAHDRSPEIFLRHQHDDIYPSTTPSHLPLRFIPYHPILTNRSMHGLSFIFYTMNI